jgi:hypothetical protein
VLPAEVVTTHTVFCLKTLLPLSRQRVSCALLNSFVANYLIRLRVNTHVTASLLSRLPVPVVDSSHPGFDRLDLLTQALAKAARRGAKRGYVELQSLVAQLYGLSGQTSNTS